MDVIYTKFVFVPHEPQKAAVALNRLPQLGQNRVADASLSPILAVDVEMGGVSG